MATNGKEYKLGIRIVGSIDKSFNTSLSAANSTLKKQVVALNSAFTQIDGGVDKFIRGVTRTVTAAAAAAGSVTAAAVASSVKLGSEFESQMSTVSAISGATGRDLEMLTETARSLAQESVFSAKEVGNAMEYMGMAGWDTTQILDGISGVLALAAASGEEFALVSDIVTDDLTAFGMKAEETQRMVDVMAQTAMNSNTTVAQMGETFKYAGAVAGAMKYNVEDLAIATGLMASAGIKDTMAGTSLRNIITRMAKPTKESSEAMKALGLSLSDDTGEMYSFLEIMNQMRKGMAGMTETEKAYYAAELGGQRGMTGLLAIANASEEEFKKLENAIYNSQGAAEAMAGARLDNLEGDVTKFKDAVSDAGLELYYQFNEEFRSAVQWATDIVNNAKTKIPEAFSKISAEFPKIKRKYDTYAKPMLNTLLSVGKWATSHGGTLLGIITGIGTALATYKVASEVTHIAAAMAEFSGLLAAAPALGPILGAVAAIGALTTAIAVYKEHEKALINQNLDDHFGKLALSMRDIEKIASALTSGGNLEEVRKAFDEWADVEDIADKMGDVVKELNKTEYKITIGLGLSEDEQDSYKTAIEEYSKQAQEFATQTRYAVNLTLNANMADADLIANVDKFYENSYDELTRIGDELGDAVTEAFEDGLLDIDEIETIQKLRKQMADIQNAITTGDYKAALYSLDDKYSDIDAASFSSLLAEVGEKQAQANEKYHDSYLKELSALYASGNATEANLEDAHRRYVMNSTPSYEGFGYLTSKISGNYSSEIANAMNSYDAIMKDYFMSGDHDWTSQYGQNVDALADSMQIDDKTTRKAITKMLDEMAPQYEDLQELMSEYRKAGEQIPQEILDGAMEYAKLRVLSGSGSSEDVWSFIGAYYSDNQELLDAINTYVTPGGEEIPDAVATAIMDNQGIIDKAVRDSYNLTGQTVQDVYGKGFNVSVPIVTQISAAERANMAQQYYSGGAKHHATGGIVNNKELSWLAENGPEAVVPLDGSKRAVSLWQRAGQLLGMDSLLDRYDLSGSSQGASVAYSPTLQFYGDAPSKDDITDALRISQDEFNDMVDRYFKGRGRVAFG
ncbi:MAG: phage tail tape measure protein [Lachnospiraceae bacterium]|nr:phage tail tape measure protein [Lachnospiraceae bacterium]